MTLYVQIIWLFILALPIACISWTVTHEEIFKEPRDFCERKSKNSKYLFTQKFFYLFTCEYCFSHYVALFFVLFTDYKLLLNDWRGYLIALFALVWIANIYTSILAIIRQIIKKKITSIEVIEKNKKLIK